MSVSTFKTDVILYVLWLIWYDNTLIFMAFYLFLFSRAPFTVQRLCELIIEPKRHYKRCDKFLRGVEKVFLLIKRFLLVKSTLMESCAAIVVHTQMDLYFFSLKGQIWACFWLMTCIVMITMAWIYQHMRSDLTTFVSMAAVLPAGNLNLILTYPILIAFF